MRRASLARVGRGVVARARRDASTSGGRGDVPKTLRDAPKTRPRVKNRRDGDARGARATPRRDATDDAIAPRA